MQMLALSSKMTLAPHCQAKFTSPPLLFSASNFFFQQISFPRNLWWKGMRSLISTGTPLALPVLAT